MTLDRLTPIRSRAQQLVIDECQAAGVNLAMLRGSAKDLELVELRKRIARRLHRETGLGTGMIGRFVGRDATTVAYYIKPEMAAVKNARKLADYHQKRALRVPA